MPTAAPKFVDVAGSAPADSWYATIPESVDADKLVARPANDSGAGTETSCHGNAVETAMQVVTRGNRELSALARKGKNRITDPKNSSRMT